MAIAQSQKKWVIWALVIAVSFSLGFLIRQPAGASTTEPGSSADPIVAKSYVDQAATFSLITVPAGKKFVADQGTEFVVRTGTVIAYNVSFGAGLANLTTGKDIDSAVGIPSNNHILTPRSGRGFRANSESLVLVKGTYKIEN